MSRGALDGLTRLVRVAGVTQMEEEAPPPRWQSAGPLPDVVTPGLDLDVDVKAEMETGLMRAADSPVSPRWSEQVERRRLSLRGARGPGGHDPVPDRDNAPGPGGGPGAGDPDRAGADRLLPGVGAGPRGWSGTTNEGPGRSRGGWAASGGWSGSRRRSTGECGGL